MCLLIFQSTNKNKPLNVQYWKDLRAFPLIMPLQLRTFLRKPSFEYVRAIREACCWVIFYFNILSNVYRESVFFLSMVCSYLLWMWIPTSKRKQEYSSSHCATSYPFDLPHVFPTAAVKKKLCETVDVDFQFQQENDFIPTKWFAEDCFKTGIVVFCSTK
jgi:hypothetical protein